MITHSDSTIAECCLQVALDMAEGVAHWSGFGPECDMQMVWQEWKTVARLASAYYAQNQTCTGGNLHVVLDDGNVDDRSILWAIDWLAGGRDRDKLKPEPDPDPDGVALLRLLLLLPEPLRWMVAEIVGGLDGVPLSVPAYVNAGRDDRVVPYPPNHPLYFQMKATRDGGVERAHRGPEGTDG